MTEMEGRNKTAKCGKLPESADVGLLTSLYAETWGHIHRAP